MLEGAIVDKFKPNYLKNPRVAIDMLNYRPFFIIGEAKPPGGDSMCGPGGRAGRRLSHIARYR